MAELDLKSIAVSVGDLWAKEVVQTLRSDDREIIGAWPGTIREARMRVRLAVRLKLELELAEELARVAYLTARTGWQKVTRFDPE